MEPKTFLIEHLPRRYQQAAKRFAEQKEWTELRMRAGAALFAVATDGNFMLTDDSTSEKKKKLICTEEDLRETLSALCEGCSYRYFDTLDRGFLTLDCGIRIGLAGEKRGTGSRLPERLTSLNLRLPCFREDAADLFLAQTEKEPLSSTLILSPPGGGKTTFLRALARRLSEGTPRRAPLRVAVIDERKELFPAILADQGSLCDVLSGVSKEEGIERAVRLFSPQVLLLDEIGSPTEAKRLAEAGSGGVILFASCHAKNKEEALLRPGIRALAEEGVFRQCLTLVPVPGKKFKATLLLEPLC